MHRPWLWTVEWVDTDAADGVKGYELTCRERAGSVCKGAEFKAAGFTLKAPEVELADTGNEIRITILSKVARFRCRAAAVCPRWKGRGSAPRRPRGRTWRSWT
jgi:hypothetical protein